MTNEDIEAMRRQHATCTGKDEHDRHVFALLDHVADLERENSALAASQCKAFYGDEHGHPSCEIEDRLAEAVRLLDDATHWMRGVVPLVDNESMQQDLTDAIAKARAFVARHRKGGRA